MSNIFMEMIAPDRILFAGEVKSVMLPAMEGEMTVFAGHEPTVASLNPGLIVVIDKEDHGHTAFVAGGFAEISSARVTILAHRALPLAELTPAHVEEEIIHHETIRAGARNPKIRHQAEFMLARLTQLQSALASGAAR
jgi:F-type H+-transporting ATPase subunit epsilon